MRSVTFLAAITLVLVVCGGGHALSRMDRMRAEQRATAIIPRKS